MPRIHITGASGAGTSTLGAALAARLRHPHVEADAIYWLPTDPPFTKLRSREDRATLVGRLLPVQGAWVFSGSAYGWTASLEPAYDLVILLVLDPVVRMARLRRREIERYGDRIAAGGDMAAASAEFLSWAAAYEVAGPEQRSRISHETWLETQSAPILRLDSSAPVDTLADTVLAQLGVGSAGEYRR